MSRVVVETCRRLRLRGYELGIAYHQPSEVVEVEGPSWQMPETLSGSAASHAEMTTRLTSILESFQPEIVYAHTRRASRHLDLILDRAAMCQFIHDQSYVCGGGHRVTRGNVACHRPHGVSCLVYNHLLGCGGLNPLNNWAWWKNTQFFVPVKKQSSLRLQVASKMMQESLLENGYEADRIDLIPLFSEPSTRPDRPEQGRILVPGRLVREKGVHVLMAAMRLLRGGYWKVCMPGGGPEAAELKKVATAWQMADRFEFPGEISPEKMADEYARCDFVVFPVLRLEPFGLIGTEALAYGKPIVAFGGGGVEEWLKPEQTGIRIELRTPEALAEGISRLLEDRVRRDRLAAGAVREFPRFHPERFIESLEVSFERTLWGWQTSRRGRGRKMDE